MFKTLKLKNFRKVSDDIMHFEQGIVALRGANESSKTTRLEAIAYAMFGTVALREPLDQTVTWGAKVSTLKVELTCALNGIEYTTTRGKSGAEVKIGSKVVATGQTEVRKYWEDLLGAPWETVTNLMLASQTNLRGILAKGGASAAVELIEKLANFGLIDKVITLIQEKLPNGQTNVVESRIASLEEQIKVPLEDGTAPLLAQMQNAEAALLLVDQSHEKLRTAYGKSQQLATVAQQKLDALKAAQVAASSAAHAADSAEDALQRLVVPDAPDEARVSELRKQVEDANRIGRSILARRIADALPEPGWEGTLESLDAEYAQAAAAHKAAAAAEAAALTEVRVLTAQKITQTACGLCGKDLSKVKEVVTKNAELDSRIAAEQSKAAAAHALVVQHAQEMADYSEIQADHQRFMRQYQQCSEFVTLGWGTIPPTWTWTGPEDLTPADNPLQTLRTAEAAVAARQQALGRHQQQEEAVATAKAQHVAAVKVLATTQTAAAGADTVLAEAARATQAFYDSEVVLGEAQRTHQNAAQALETERRVVQVRREAREALEAALSAARAELTGMAFNNALIKRLREIRPEITNELWAVAAGAISSTFSDIRGTASIFTRDTDGFRINGQSVAGLSGSTQDALGLAIRMVLTNIFLPNTRWLVLDEPAAAADMDREANMLGVLATAKFDQTIVVTHSDLVQSFATQVIAL